jgi:type IV pilus assembly protein PilE
MTNYHSCAPMKSGGPLRSGFTLIELMVAVAIVSILTAVALPLYSNYVLRSAVQEGVQALAADRVKMEQYFMDNRSYGTGAQCGSGVGAGKTIDPAVAGKFTMSCTLGDGGATYLISATGSGSLANFVYTVNEAGTMASRITKAGWPSDCPTSWAVRPGAC